MGGAGGSEVERNSAVSCGKTVTRSAECIVSAQRALFVLDVLKAVEQRLVPRPDCIICPKRGAETIVSTSDIKTKTAIHLRTTRLGDAVSPRRIDLL